MNAQFLRDFARIRVGANQNSYGKPVPIDSICPITRLRPPFSVSIDFPMSRDDLTVRADHYRNVIKPPQLPAFGVSEEDSQLQY